MLACAGVMCAQPRTFPIVSLKVEGNKIYSSDRILAAAGLRIGDMATKEKFEAARQKLIDSGFFESVGYKYGPSDDKTGYSAAFEVTEVQQAYAVKFERLPRPDAELRKALPRPIHCSAIVFPARSRSSSVTAKCFRNTSRVSTIVLWAAFSRTRRISLQSCSNPPQGRPRSLKCGSRKHRSFPHQFCRTPSLVLQSEPCGMSRKFRQILDISVRPLYEARGRLMASYTKITTEPYGGENLGCGVKVEVDEGEPFTLGEVALASPPIPDRDMRKEAGFKKGDLANFDEINAGLERMRTMIRRNGYMDAKVTADRKLDQTKKEVSLTVRFDPGQRYIFSKLNLIGLDIITEPVVRKMWGMKEGSPFNPEYPEFFLNRVREDNIFENLGKTKSAVKTDPATALPRSRSTSDNQAGIWYVG